MIRKLKFNEMILLTKLLKDVEIRKFIIETDFKSGDQIELATMVIAHILENANKAEQTLYELVSRYGEINLEKVPHIDADEVFEILKNIFTTGLPTALQKIFKNDEIKKKLTQVISN